MAARMVVVVVHTSHIWHIIQFEEGINDGCNVGYTLLRTHQINSLKMGGHLHGLIKTTQNGQPMKSFSIPYGAI